MALHTFLSANAKATVQTTPCGGVTWTLIKPSPWLNWNFNVDSSHKSDFNPEIGLISDLGNRPSMSIEWHWIMMSYIKICILCVDKYILFKIVNGFDHTTGS